MRQSDQPKGRFFTDAARAAALAARQAKALLPKRDGFEAFAVRMTGEGKAFRWEIRQFGALVVWRGHVIFATSAEAYEAGNRALIESRLETASQ